MFLLLELMILKDRNYVGETMMGKMWVRARDDGGEDGERMRGNDSSKMAPNLSKGKTLRQTAFRLATKNCRLAFRPKIPEAKNRPKKARKVVLRVLTIWSQKLATFE
jgi:hypothetical protein